MKILPLVRENYIDLFCLSLRIVFKMIRTVSRRTKNNKNIKPDLSLQKKSINQYKVIKLSTICMQKVMIKSENI